MQFTKLGNSDLSISKIGLGSAPIGSTLDWKIYWGKQEINDAIDAIETAIALGVNWIDTAPFYGWGRAEKIIGEVLKNHRDKMMVFTKCGTLQGEAGDWITDLTPESIRQEIDTSLKLLGIDRIDLYQCHSPDPDVPVEETWGALMELIDAGKIRHAGLSNYPTDEIEKAVKVGPVVSTQNQYNILQGKETEQIFSFAHKRNIGTLTWGTLASGFLTAGFDLARLEHNDFRHNYSLGKLFRTTEFEAIMKSLNEIAHDENMTLEHLAVQWLLQQNMVTAVIIGARNRTEAKAFDTFLGKQISNESLSRINKARTKALQLQQRSIA